MKATLIYGAGDVRVEEVPDPKVENPTDAVVRITHSCICGSDLWPYKNREATDEGGRIGHEFIGVVEETGSDVSRHQAGRPRRRAVLLRRRHLRVLPRGSDQRLPERQRLGRRDRRAQGEAARVPFADHVLMPLDVPQDSELMPSLLTLSDVFGTGHHAAVDGGRRAGQGRRGRRRRRRRPARRARQLAARRRAHRAHGPPQGPHRPRPGVRRHRRRAPSAARRASRRSATSSAPTARTAPSRPSGSTSRSPRRST